MREDRGFSGDGQRIEQLAWIRRVKIADDKNLTGFRGSLNTAGRTF